MSSASPKGLDLLAVRTPSGYRSADEGAAWGEAPWRRWIGAATSGGPQGRATGPVIDMLLAEMDGEGDMPTDGPLAASELIWRGRQLGDGPVPAPDDAQGLLFNFMTVPVEAEAEFNAWYDTEHIPRISAVAGVLAARRFWSEDDPLRYLAAYHLAVPEICTSEAWSLAAASPWTRRIQGLRTAGSRLLFRASSFPFQDISS